MDGERRRHSRTTALHRLTFEWQGHIESAVMTDVSESGAFVHTEVYPPVGTRLELGFAPDAGPGVVFHVCVARTARDGEVPGIGVSWRVATSVGTAEHLHGVLKRILHVKVPVGRLKDGRAVWVAAASRVPMSHGLELTFYVNRRPVRGVVRDITRRGMNVLTADIVPRAGDVVTCHFPLAGEQQARLVCLVSAAAAQGFTLELQRIDNPPTARFEDYVDQLVAQQCQAILREFYALTRSASALATVG